jgi:SMC interacting uncharacterized protein involved in chromosome segregation
MPNVKKLREEILEANELLRDLERILAHTEELKLKIEQAQIEFDQRIDDLSARIELVADIKQIQQRRAAEVVD